MLENEVTLSEHKVNVLRHMSLLLYPGTVDVTGLECTERSMSRALRKFVVGVQPTIILTPLAFIKSSVLQISLFLKVCCCIAIYFYF